MTNGITITTNGDIKDFNEEFTLDSIYSELQVSNIEILPLGDSIQVYVDGEGLLKESNPNIYGTAVCEALTGWQRMQTIHGDILFFGGHNEDGVALPLTEDQDQRIRHLLVQSRG